MKLIIYARKTVNYAMESNSRGRRQETGSEYLFILMHICGYMRVILTLYYIHTMYNEFRDAHDKILNGLSQKIETMTSDLKNISFHGNTAASPLASSSGFSNAILSILAKVSLPPQLDRNGFEKTFHWFPDEYRKLRRKAEKSGVLASDDDVLLETDESDPGAPKKKVPILSCFLEDKDGIYISESQKKDLLSMAANYWQYLLDKNRAPRNFRRVNLEIKLQWRALMESQFNFVRFCDGHWKSDQIWINYYTTWRKTALRKLREEKEQTAKESGDAVIDVDDDEGTDDADEDAVQGAQGARRSKKNKKGPSDGEARPSKRPRVDEPRTTSAPGRPRPTMASTTRARVRKLLLFIICVTNNI